MHHCPVIYSMMQWHEFGDWQIAVFNMPFMLTHKSTLASHLLSPSTTKLKCMCCDLISQTLAADNKTKWFHKSPREQPVCYELCEQVFFFPDIQHEEFSTASILSGHPFYFFAHLLSKATLKQWAHKVWDLPDHCRFVTQTRLLVLNNCMDNSTHGKHSFENMRIRLWWQIQFLFSQKKKKTEHLYVRDIPLLRSEDRFWGQFNMNFMTMLNKLKRSKYFFFDGRHVACKWLQLDWTEKAICSPGETKTKVESACVCTSTG